MAGAGPFSRADFPRVFANRLPFMSMLIGPEEWPEADQMWEPLFNVKSSDRMREEILEYAGFGQFKLMGENDAVTYDQLIQGPAKVFTHALYGLGFQIGYMAAKHDLDGIIERNAPELGRSLRMSIQTLAASFWNGAFDIETTADGQTVFSTTHTFIRGGGTFSNRSSSTLGLTSLQTGLIAFRRQKDLMGQPMPLVPENLLIPPELEPIAHELMNSQYRPDTGATREQQESWVRGKLKPYSWPFLTISTMWAILAPKAQHKVNWYWNIRPETSNGFDFDKEASKTKTLFAASFGAIDPRGLYGSKGV